MPYQILKISILFALMFFCTEANSQTQNWEWAKSTGKYISHDYSSAISTDLQGNSFITGEFQDSLVFGNTTLLNTGTYGYVMYIAKYDNQGNVIWANTPGGNHSAHGYGICTDANGNFYVTGSFTGTIIFGATSLTGTGIGNMFIAKFDSSGNALWSQKASANFSCKGTGVAVDNSGNVFVTGVHEDTISFGSISLPGNILSEIFLAKYDDFGNLLWAKSGNGHGADVSNGICTDENGNVYITGAFRDSIILGSTTLYGSNNGSASVLIVKYDGLGNVLWAKSSGGFPSSGFGKDISTDLAGNCYVTGYFGSPIIYFDGDTLTSSGVEDAFILKLNANGNVSWARQGGGPSYDRGNSICTDEEGNSYITGFFKNFSSFGNIQFSGISNELFVVKYDSSGNVIWGLQNTGSVNETGNGISFDGNNNVYISGEFSSPTSIFGINTLVNSDQFLGSYDLLIAKINTITTNINDINESDNAVSIFPNPITTNGSLILNNCNETISALCIYDSHGRIVHRVSELVQGNVNIEKGNLSPGLYLVKIFYTKNKSQTVKLMIQ